jgi:hypothetical protein
MVNNLKSCAPVMYRLFTALKERPAGHPITEEEINIASGKKVLDSVQAKIYAKNLETASENIRLAFEKQTQDAAVSTTYIIRKHLLIEV